MKSRRMLSIFIVLTIFLSISGPVFGEDENMTLYCVQASVVSNKDNAYDIALDLYNLGFEGAFVFDDPNSHNFYVMAGGFEYKDDADKLRDEVREHVGYEGAWVTTKTLTQWDITMAADLVEETWFTVQTGVFSSKENALNQVQKMIDDGLEDAFGLFLPDETYNYYALAGKFKIREDAEAYAELVTEKGYDYFIKEFTFRNIDTFRPDDPVREYPPHEEFMILIDELPNPEDITEIVVTDKVNAEKARALYEEMSEEERGLIEEGYLEKLEAVEAKIQSLKSPIISQTRSNVRQAQAWAVKRGAHKRYVDIATVYWQYGNLMGMRPEILYTQSAKETNFGKYTGAVTPDMNNWAGIKIADPVGDRPEDHETFATPEDGVRGHFNHLGIYCGVDPIGEPHPRWYKTREAEWAGSIQYVEDLGGLWAPNPDYGISIIRDYLVDFYNTPEPAEGVLEAALDFSDRVEEFEDIEEIRIEDVKVIKGIIDEYDSILSEEEKALIPYNIKDTVEELRELFNTKASEVVIDAINELPALEDLTLEDKEMVEIIREAYEVLTNEQKELVTNVEKLIAAEEKIAELEKDEEPKEPTDPKVPKEPKEPKDPKDPKKPGKPGKPSKPGKPKGKLPKTGDSSVLGQYTSGLILVILGIYLKRKDI